MYDEFKALTKAFQATVPDTKDQYTEYVARKSDWQPATYDSNLSLPETPLKTHEALLRALAIALVFEVPVGEYTLESAKKEFTVSQKYALYSNSLDELTHYRALSNFQNALGNNPYLQEADSFRKQLETIPEHPLLKSGYMELGVFFTLLAMFRKYGNFPLKQLSLNISRDESSHVLTNWSILDQNNIRSTLGALDTLRKQLIDYVSRPILGREGVDFWLRQSNNLISTRKATELDFTKQGHYVAFFEVPNSSLAAY